MATYGTYSYSVAGSNGAGALTAASAVVGDKVLQAEFTGLGLQSVNKLEPVVSVAGQIQQTSTENLSGVTFNIITSGLH